MSHAMPRQAVKGDASLANDGTMTISPANGVTQDIIVLVGVLPSVFVTLHFADGILTDVT